MTQYAAGQEDLTAALDDPGAEGGAEDSRSVAHYLRGLAREFLENDRGARDDYDRAIGLGYDGPEVFERRAEVRERGGDHPGAAADREAASSRS